MHCKRHAMYIYLGPASLWRRTKLCCCCLGLDVLFWTVSEHASWQEAHILSKPITPLSPVNIRSRCIGSATFLRKTTEDISIEHPTALLHQSLIALLVLRAYVSYYWEIRLQVNSRLHPQWWKSCTLIPLLITHLCSWVSQLSFIRAV